MLQLKELARYLDDYLPGNGVKDYCPNGLQVEGKNHIARLGTAVSASLATIEAAVERNIDALIVHHGMFWQGDSFVIQGVKRKKLQLLLEHKISLFAYHLPLDMHPVVGNNWKAAFDMQWGELEPFAFLNGVPIGVKGRILSTKREEFKQQLERYYQHGAVCALGGLEEIQTVALVSGGGYRHIGEAALEGIDAFITGNFDEPAWHLAMEEGVNFYAMGHSATERVGPIALAEHLEKTFSLSCHFLDIANPF